MRTTITIAAVLSLSACSDWTETADGFTDTDHALIASMVLPGTPPPDPTNGTLTEDVNTVQAVVHLGKRLFFDTQLSVPNGISCASCHNPRAGFMDNRSQPNNVSQGVPTGAGVPQFTKRNSLGLWDVGFYAWWGWDGRSDSLWMQCAVAYESGATMHGDRAKLRRTMLTKHFNEYAAAFPTGTPLFVPNDVDGGYDTVIDEAVAANAYKAMATYLTQLVLVDAPFDRYAAGDDGALPPDAKRGLKLFLGDAGCITCHNGPAFNGAGGARSDEDFFRTVGISQRGANVPLTDNGRFGGVNSLVGLDPKAKALSVYNSAGPYNDTIDPVTGKRGIDRATPLRDGGTPTDVGRFRIKGLRNVALTAPYMHAGQLATLDDVVHFYNGGGDDSGFDGTRDRQLQPLGLSESQLSDLVQFLESLTGVATDTTSGFLCDPLAENDAGIIGCDGGYP
jgi:cytochrome c peroxidase